MKVMQAMQQVELVLVSLLLTTHADESAPWQPTAGAAATYLMALLSGTTELRAKASILSSGENGFFTAFFAYLECNFYR